jgi:hypothetical protein
MHVLPVDIYTRLVKGLGLGYEGFMIFAFKCCCGRRRLHGRGKKQVVNSSNILRCLYSSHTMQKGDFARQNSKSSFHP